MEEEESRCMYFVKRKNRYCRMTVKKGNKYCGEHQQDSFNSNDIEIIENCKKRIQCPLDPTHTCYQSKLSKHLTICNARKMLDARPAYIIKNINLDNETEEIPRLLPLSRLDISIVDNVILRINEAGKIRQLLLINKSEFTFLLAHVCPDNPRGLSIVRTLVAQSFGKNRNQTLCYKVGIAKLYAGTRTR
ncbi:tRNA:m(4)X modification enzyme TRM13 homolog [Polistes fuscatus]|uniref:tRNA:m(4)X modification enzyme TRM13 homolog n=1 Tax=Polistes fuscatus TaxID=30207 RepID=UPI001CA9823E|nr:tRNA:m(4)X modification enzyme TRM13 homolog [Polistes fuscatus]